MVLDSDVNWDEELNTVSVNNNSIDGLTVSGNNNIIAVGEDIIANIVRLYGMEKVNDKILEADKLYEDLNIIGAIDKYEEILKNISSAKNPEV